MTAPEAAVRSIPESGSGHDPRFADDPTVVVDDLTKWFGQKVAVSELSCSFGPGVTGLLGPNGAGKTTLLRVVVGLLVPSQGSVRILGRDPREDHHVYRDVGLVPESEALYDHLTARRFVETQARLAGVADPRTAAHEALETVDLLDAADRRIAGFSKGMRQRTKVAAALAHDPRVLILDEPLNGADPLQRARLIDLFRSLGADGRTVIVSSHVLHEVERMADRVIAMVDGRLAAAGSVASLRRAMADIPLSVLVETDDPRRLAAALVALPEVVGVSLDGSSLRVQTQDAAALGRALPRLARELGVRVRAIAPEDDSLESVFRYLVSAR